MSDTLDKLANELGERLKQRGKRLATAESCTGGGLSYWITNIAGSSDWFECGFVTYSNAAKVAMLSVNPNTIENYGAVSQEACREMVEGALARSIANVSIAITGIAGPSGGSAEKPVGTVWIGWGGVDLITQVEGHLFLGDRQSIRLQSIERAMQGLLERLV
jgi:nicotinamide-nucleotide amidase